MATYAAVSTQLGAVQPKTKSIAPEVWTQTKLAGHAAYRLYGYPGSGGPEHGSGYAVDFMVGHPGHHDDGQAIRDYVWTHRSRLGLHWVIWEQHVTTAKSGVPRLMEDRGGVTANHYDHVHAFFDNPPLDYEPKPPVYPVRTLARGVSGSDVAALQKGLNAVFDFDGADLIVDGSFGAATEADVKAYQVLKKLEDDGRVGPITRRSLTTTSGISL